MQSCMTVFFQASEKKTYATISMFRSVKNLQKEKCHVSKGCDV